MGFLSDRMGRERAATLAAALTIIALIALISIRASLPALAPLRLLHLLRARVRVFYPHYFRRVGGYLLWPALRGGRAFS